MSSKLQVIWIFAFLFIYAQAVISQDNEPDLIEVHVQGQEVRSAIPSNTYTSPVSLFRYEPSIDVQSKNFSEAQSDISIRGGIFDNTGVTLGALGIFDPQTGHYTTEIPIPARMLSVPNVITGSENAIKSTNATVGSVFYLPSSIERSEQLSLGSGDHSFNIQEATAGDVFKTLSGDNYAAEFNIAHSSSSGTRADGDSELARGAGRVQAVSAQTQTDLIAGYQDKRFQWPYLYAPKELHEILGSSGIESEEIQTTLILLNHNYKPSSKEQYTITSYYRHNHDDYEFDFYNKGLFNPYRHNTDVYGIGLQALTVISDPVYLKTGASFLSDNITSTALTFGDFSSRNYEKISIVPGIKKDIGNTVVDAFAGVSFDDTNRDDERFSPVTGLSVEPTDNIKAYVEYSETSSVPGYTALKSNPEAGLFRGNSSLERLVSKNTETGILFNSLLFESKIDVFHRKDENLTDWTYDMEAYPGSARNAQNVDVETVGVEVMIKKEFPLFDFIGGYTFLTKSSDFEDADTLGSFYALNYPKHRLLLSASIHVSESVDFYLENEFRRQFPNPLRSSDDLTYNTVSAAVRWSSPTFDKVNLALVVYNLAGEYFEEVPGVPGAGRQISVICTYNF